MTAIVENLGVEGVTWRPPPPPVVNQAVPRTTPSRRRVTRYGLVHNGWGVRRHCGRLAGGCSFPREKMQERKTTQQAEKGKSHPPPKNQETPEKNQKHTRTPNREAATRPKKHRTETAGFPEQKKRKKKTGNRKKPGGRALM